MFKLETNKRENGANLDQIRNGGQIPAVFYGAGKETSSIAISLIEFKKIWREAGESSAIKLAYDGGEIDVLIHEVQAHPVSGEPVHVDFLAIDMNKVIEVSVPLEFVGISGAVKNGLGNLVKALHEVEVEALPKDLPQELEVDLTKLETIDDQIFVSDIKLPAGVTMKNEADEVVASIVAQVEESEEPAAEMDLSAIEVEKKGKQEEEGEATAEGATE